MQFRLPTQLQQELLAYDPTFKALAKQQKATSKTKKTTHPLGKPNQLIPTEVLPVSLYNDAIDNINSQAAPDRYQLFTRIVDGVVTPYAILYHFEQVWYAAWLPPKHQKDQYIYGYSFAFKDNASAYKMLPHRVRQHLDVDNPNKLSTYQLGRVQYFTFNKLVTRQDIIDGYDAKNWNIPSVQAYYKKSGNLYQQLKAFEDQLFSTIPMWSDSRSTFARLQAINPACVIFTNDYRYGQQCTEYWQQHDITKAVISYDLLFKLITQYAHGSGYDGDIYRTLNKVLHIIATPFFKKWIQARCDEVNTNFYNPENQLLRSIRASWGQIHALFDAINWVYEVWPECPIDYCQTYINQLLSFKSTRHGTLLTQAWLNNHMPVASFFSILEKEYEREMNSTHTRYNYDSDLQCPRFYYSNWSDTISMLDTILAHNACTTEPLTLDVPKRWRLMEFHDHVQSIAWKVKNKNESLPQDLFPEPVKLGLGSSKWTFFQPVDTHQLAAWGQAVRNCVGSASGYADGVRKKKHFIVLCMIDSKPMFTIQLEVNMGMMSVKQIAGIGNARLTDEERELYTTAFSKALTQRESALTSA
jgi:hypothetical protein